MPLTEQDPRGFSQTKYGDGDDEEGDDGEYEYGEYEMGEMGDESMPTTVKFLGDAGE